MQRDTNMTMFVTAYSRDFHFLNQLDGFNGFGDDLHLQRLHDSSG